MAADSSRGSAGGVIAQFLVTAFITDTSWRSLPPEHYVLKRAHFQVGTGYDGVVLFRAAADVGTDGARRRKLRRAGAKTLMTTTAPRRRRPASAPSPIGSRSETQISGVPLQGDRDTPNWPLLDKGENIDPSLHKKHQWWGKFWSSHVFISTN